MALSLNDISQHLDQVIETNDEIIVLHSSVWQFGHLVRPFDRDFLDQLLDVIIKTVGAERTLVVPSYTTGSFPRSKKYDDIETLPETGALPTALLHRGSSIRTSSPMNSYLVSGPHSDAILDCVCTSAWGRDSVMAFLASRNARFVTLGAEWHLSCSYYHHAEELAKVPYRYFKRFQGDRYAGGKYIGTCSDVLFVKSLYTICDDFYAGPELVLRERKHIKTADAPYLIESALIRNIVDVTIELLSENPFYFVKNENEVRDWVENGLRDEVLSLHPDQASSLNENVLSKN